MTPRLLCQVPDVGGMVTVNTDQSHYLLKVLRLSVGDSVEIFNGLGLRFQGKIVAIQGKSATLGVEPGRPYNPPRGHNIWLLQGLPSGDKMDWIIEKAVELGVARFTPMECERSVVKLSGPRLDKKMTHWRGEIEAACMQSQRDDLMVLEEAEKSEACFERLKPETFKFLLEPGSALGLLSALKSLLMAARITDTAVLRGDLASKAIIMAIGPESGFSDRERWHAEQAGFLPVHLGSQVLRTETAALVATAKLQAWLEMIEIDSSTTTYNKIRALDIFS